MGGASQSSLLSAPEVTNLLTFVLVIITCIYAWLTWRIANSTSNSIKLQQEQFEATMRPVISVNLEIRENVVFCLKITNSGRSTAERLKLTLDSDFVPFAAVSGTNLRDMIAFSKEIPTLAPGEGLRFNLTQGFNVDTTIDGKNLTPSAFSVRARYDGLGRRYDEVRVVDFMPYMGTHNPLSAAEALRRLDETIKTLSKQQRYYFRDRLQLISKGAEDLASGRDQASRS